jgi:3-oxoacyl-[acyl-carrier protein] reductase
MTPPGAGGGREDCMHIDLSGKRVIVTGASRGIGKGIASAFAREGAKLAVCARNADAIEAAAEEYRALGAADVIARVVDVKVTDQVNAFVAEVAERWGGVDVLVNNAG